jgi:CRISPR-associated protein Cas5/CasD subtype I-E
MGVRIDRPGCSISDYHTVGAGLGNFSAEGKIKITNTTHKIETFVTWREYLCDASFLVALQQPQPATDPTLLEEISTALQRPVWPPYLGRKSCPPSRPLLELSAASNPSDEFDSLETALRSVPWSNDSQERPKELDVFLEWRGTSETSLAPPEAVVLYDVPISFSPPAHGPRFVVHKTVPLADLRIEPRERGFRNPERLLRKEPRRADYADSTYRKKRCERLRKDHNLCVFCKSPAVDVHHVTYERAGGDESLEDLRSVCKLCHDAITMIEYGLGVTAHRIDPCDPRWRSDIIAKRNLILRCRSLAKRRRWLTDETSEELL